MSLQLFQTHSDRCRYGMDARLKSKGAGKKSVSAGRVRFLYFPRGWGRFKSCRCRTEVGKNFNSCRTLNITKPWPNTKSQGCHIWTIHIFDKASIPESLARCAVLFSLLRNLVRIGCNDFNINLLLNILLSHFQHNPKHVRMKNILCLLGVVIISKWSVLKNLRDIIFCHQKNQTNCGIKQIQLLCLCGGTLTLTVIVCKCSQNPCRVMKHRMVGGFLKNPTVLYLPQCNWCFVNSSLLIWILRLFVAYPNTTQRSVAQRPMTQKSTDRQIT